jgi:hypothetical protein
MDAHRSKPAKDRRALAWDDPDLRVSAPVQPRVSQGGPYVAEHVFGCFSRKKNICRASLPLFKALELDRICTLLNSWVASLKEEASKGESLLLLTGVDRTDEGTTSSLIVLLVDIRLSPKMQFCTYCVLPAAPEQIDVAMPLVFPFRVKIAVRASRLSALFRSVYDITSDELGMHMVDKSMSWKLAPLQWAWTCDGGLLDMDSIGRGEEFEPPKKVKKTKANRADPLADVLMLDPFAFGRAAGAAFRMDIDAGDSDAAAGDDGDDRDQDP